MKEAKEETSFFVKIQSVQAILLRIFILSDSFR